MVACGGSANAPASPTAEPTATPTPPVATPTPSGEAAVITATTPISAVTAITVGVNAEFKPFVYMDEAGRLTGFDIDLMNALGKAGGFEFGFVNLPFEELLSEVESGKIDAAISAITVNDERKARFAFTDPYFGAGQAVVSYFSGGQGLAVRTDNMTITGTASLLPTMTVGVKEGTTGATFVGDNIKSKAVTFPEAEPALAALAAGKVDAVVVDLPVIVSYIKTHANSGIKLAGPPLTEEQYAIAVNQGKPEVLALLNTALAKVRADGTYDAIFQKWFGAP